MSEVRNWLQGAVARVRAFAAERRARRHPEPKRIRVGLALGGGFARGVAHIGVLRVLEENKIPIDCLAGTSVGAMIAAAYASGSPLAEMEHRATATQFRDFARWTLSWLGVATNERLENYLHQFSDATRFEDLKIPLAITATDLGTGEPVYFTEGELGLALRASCAYPGLFLPVEYQSRIFVDGFLSAPVPVEAVRQLGADRVIAVYLESSPVDVKPENMIDVIGRSFSIMQRHTQRVWRRDADVVIEPDVAHFDWKDFEKTPALIAAGEAAARASLPQIRAALAPRTGGIRVKAVSPRRA